MADGLAAAGAKIVVLGRKADEGARKSAEIRATGAEAMWVEADVLDAEQLRNARDKVVAEWGGVDILINAAGGSVARSRTDNKPVFDMPLDAFEEVLQLNLHGSIKPSLIFGEVMAEKKRGVILNISSMAAQQAMTGVLGYSVAKAGIDTFTKWMAMDLAQRYGDGIRVNAIAPGFFVTTQNRNVLMNEDGTYTDRSKRVLAQTPMKRFGRPEELNGAVQWLCSDAASFVTGTVIPVDGGFSIFSGV